MKEFSRDEVFNRLINRAQKNAKWSKISTDSDIAFLFRAFAENLSELARYGEYLLAETKWDRCKNLSSVLSMVRFLGYKPPRKISAIGTIVISHDPLLQQLGKFNPIFGKVITLSDLSPFQGQQTPSIFLPAGTTVSKDGKIEFITLEDATLSSSATTEEGLKYVRVPIVQGIRKKITVQMTGGIPFEEIVIENPNVENASLDSPSRRFFKVIVKNSFFDVLTNETRYIEEEWQEIDDLRGASYYDKVFEIVPDVDQLKSLIIRFGTGSSGKLLPEKAIVDVYYLETMGVLGNVENRFEVNTIAPYVVDQNTQIPLYCTNDDPILGGTTLESIETIKAKASSYAVTVKSVGNTESYEQAIRNIPSIHQAKVFAGTKVLPNQITQDVIYFTVIDSLGERPSRDNILAQVKAVISDRKSPTDLLEYSPAQFVPIHFNVKAFVRETGVSFQTIKERIQQALFQRYHILNLKFKEPLLARDLSSILNRMEGIYNYQAYKEALLILPNPKGALSGSGILISFEFDESFVHNFGQFKNFEHGVQHLLKIQLLTTNPLLNRTMFLTKEDVTDDPQIPENQRSRIVLRKFQHFSRITDIQFMNTLLKAYPYLGRFNPQLNNNDLIQRLSGILPAENDDSNAPLSERSFEGFSVTFNPKTGQGSLYIPTEYSLLLGNTPFSSSVSNLTVKIYAEPFSQDFIPKTETTIYKYYFEDNNVEVIFDAG